MITPKCVGLHFVYGNVNVTLRKGFIRLKEEMTEATIVSSVFE